MRLRTLIVLGTAAAMTIAAAAALPSAPARAQAAAKESGAPKAVAGRLSGVDLNAPVTSGTQCMPCHADLSRSRTPGLLFSHAAHIMYSCEGCHTAPPHTGGASISPDMSTCFSCHGLRHGKKELARRDCAACHTARWELRPKDHVADWKVAPHAASARLDANRCLMCHDAATCDSCHARTAPDAPPTQPSYRPILRARPRAAVIRVMPDSEVTMGQCVNCHPDVDDFMPGRVIFAHATHLERAFACKDCHRSFAHGPDSTTRPDMPSCYQCHGLVHAGKGLVATEKCEDCHPKDFQLKPADHTAAFVARKHREAANASPESCAMCHQASFCSDCHRGLPKRPGGSPRRKVVPSDHRLATFRSLHGKNFLNQRGACGSCHDSPSCERCHKTPMPHPADWTQSHSLAPSLDSADCNVCHTDRQRCQECHHDGKRGSELIEANCVGCHEVMRQRPRTKIKNKGLAEHAVHFDVAKKKGKPYTCEECHVGFGLATATSHQGGAKLNQGHDLRLCYECHGALDYQNVLIAPYPGNSLCIRCHSDLNL